MPQAGVPVPLGALRNVRHIGGDGVKIKGWKKNPQAGVPVPLGGPYFACVMLVVLV